MAKYTGWSHPGTLARIDTCASGTFVGVLFWPDVGVLIDELPLCYGAELSLGKKKKLSKLSDGIFLFIYFEGNGCFRVSGSH